MTVDTLSLARDLRAAQVPQSQAEAIALAIGRALTETSATHADLVNASADVHGEIRGLDQKVLLGFQKLETKIEALRSSLLLWFIGTNTALAAMILAALKL